MWCWLNWIIFLIGSKVSWTYLAASLWSTIKLLWDLAWVVTSLGLSVFICKFMTMKQKSSMSHSNSDIRWIKKGQIFTTASYDTFWDIKLCFLLHFLFLPFPLQAWVQEGFASGLRTWEEEELVWITADQESDAPTQTPWCLDPAHMWQKVRTALWKWRGGEIPDEPCLLLCHQTQMETNINRGNWNYSLNSVSTAFIMQNIQFNSFLLGIRWLFWCPTKTVSVKWHNKRDLTFFAI